MATGVCTSTDTDTFLSPNTPVQQPNFFNIDEQLFTVFVTNLNITKTVTTIRDPSTRGAGLLGCTATVSGHAGRSLPVMRISVRQSNRTYASPRSTRWQTAQ